MIIHKTSEVAEHFGGTETTHLTLEEALAEFPEDKNTTDNVVQLSVPCTQNQQRNKG